MSNRKVLTSLPPHKIAMNRYTTLGEGIYMLSTDLEKALASYNCKIVLDDDGVKKLIKEYADLGEDLIFVEPEEIYKLESHYIELGISVSVLTEDNV